MSRILLVDDDAGVLQALRRELLRDPDVSPEGLELEALDSPGKALCRAAEPDGYFDVVIADYRMPGMDGVEFLAAFARLQPDSVRVLLSGQVDRETLAGAVNRAGLDFFLAKPWEEYRLKALLVEALSHRRERQENRRLAGEVAARLGGRSPFRARTCRILLVDDEPAILHALRRELADTALLLRGWRLHAWEEAASGPLPALVMEDFASPEAALEAVRNHGADVVVADYHMPAMDGIAFLEAVRECAPDSARILLSGQADVDTLAEAVNRAGIYHFIAKPWDASELGDTVGRALAWGTLQRENRVLAELVRSAERGNERH